MYVLPGMWKSARLADGGELAFSLPVHYALNLRHFLKLIFVKSALFHSLMLVVVRQGPVACVTVMVVG